MRHQRRRGVGGGVQQPTHHPKIDKAITRKDIPCGWTTKGKGGNEKEEKKERGWRAGGKDKRSKDRLLKAVKDSLGG